MSPRASGQEAHPTKTNGAESVARMVFSFVSGAQDFVEGMDGSDDMRLLRLRTRKSEIVIVPGLSFGSKSQMNKALTFESDPKFLLVVIHDAPQA